MGQPSECLSMTPFACVAFTCALRNASGVSINVMPSTNSNTASHICSRYRPDGETLLLNTVENRDGDVVETVRGVDRLIDGRRSVAGTNHVSGGGGEEAGGYTVESELLGQSVW